MVDGELVSLKPIPRGSSRQSSRTGKAVVTNREVTEDGARVEPVQNRPERPIRQAPTSVPTGQSVLVAGKRSAVDPERPAQTHRGEIPRQSVPEAGKRPAPTHRGEPLGQSVPGAGKRPAVGPERPTPTHKGEPPRQSEPVAGKRPTNSDSSEWTAYAAQPLGQLFGPSCFFAGKVEGKPAWCPIDAGCTTNLLGNRVRPPT